MSHPTHAPAAARRLQEMHHRDRPIVLPTVWDAWSARTVASAGFEALTVGSHPVADSRGSADGETMTLDEALDGVARVVGAVDVPVSADLESGYDTSPEELVDRLLATGAVGLNLEDTVHARGTMRSPEEHAAYIRRMRVRADAAGVPLVINARTDAFKHAGSLEDPTAEALHRLRLMEEAGADCLYPVAVPSTAVLEQLLAAVSTPLNVTAHPERGAVPDQLDLDRLAALGVRRVSFGPLLQQAAGEHIAQLLDGWR
ncbi:oxaloacetate decarboxylase [Nesterenkonia halophila]|uniref:isocitrate lyase/PEP mutase family protein n=1 Tax=Nesterenkonia halophila TaxID=302044 RepID=UPI0012928225|nr:isocitrate lyase/phosphoenolpyruvate mutase family protein [Nesterenkonia halophila]